MTLFVTAIHFPKLNSFPFIFPSTCLMSPTAGHYTHRPDLIPEVKQN